MARARVTEGPAIEDLPKRHDALLILDVDEVVLHFVQPFRQILREHGAQLRFESFALTGNVRSLSTGAAITGHEVSGLTETLYAEQETRQTAVEGVAAVLDDLSRGADIVFLTAMTPAHHAVRRRLLDREALPYPMIATERSKGAVVAELAARWNGPIVFVDDLPQNLDGVRRSLERTQLVHMMADDELRPHLPPLPRDAHSARGWGEARPLLAALLGGDEPPA